MKISKIIKLFALMAIVSFAMSKFTRRKKLLVKLDSSSNKEEEITKTEKQKEVKNSTESIVKFKNQIVQSQVTNTSESQSTAGEDKLNKLLNHRQEDILQIIKTLGQIDMPKLASVFKKVTDRTLRRDLLKLAKVKLIEKIGDTKGASYKAI